MAGFTFWIVFAVTIWTGAVNGRKHKDLLVMAPPSVDQEIFFNLNYSHIAKFYTKFSRSMRGRDNFLLLMPDQQTWKFYRKLGFSHKKLIKGATDIPWKINDVALVNTPGSPVQFKFNGGMHPNTAKVVQKHFNKFIDKLNVHRNEVEYINDGGNMVYNGNDVAIVTDKFLMDNRMEVEEAQRILKKTLKVSNVSIITADELNLGHADTMVAFTCRYTVLLSTTDNLRETVKNEILRGCPRCKIVDMPRFEDSSELQVGRTSVCGSYVHLVVTQKHIYMPLFSNTTNDKRAMKIVKANSCGKKVIPINIRPICRFGGGLRNLSWKVDAKNAIKISRSMMKGKKAKVGKKKHN